MSGVAAQAASIFPGSSADSMDVRDLLAAYKETGDEQLKWEIVLRYEHIVKCTAMQVRGIYSSFAQLEDIINEGLITLLKSIDTYDPEKGVKFETYVSKRIRGMVIDLARKQDWMPRSVRRRAKEIDEITLELANDLGRYPTSGEVARRLGVSEDKYQKDLACIAMSNVVSLEMLMDTGEPDAVHFEVASRDGSGMPDQVLETREMVEVLAEAIRGLRENEQMVLSLHYVENLLLKDIAQVMEISEPRVSQLHTRAIGKLRKEMAKYLNVTELDVGESPRKREKKV